MAQFNALRELVTKEKIKATSLKCIYTRRMNFPAQFRGDYASWIESQEWPAEATDEYAKSKFDEFVDILKNDLAQKGSSMEAIDFRSRIDNFEEHFEGCYTNFVQVIRTILKTEENLILSSQEPASTDDRRMALAQENPEITKRINALRAKLRGTEVELSKLEETQEKDTLEFQELTEKIKQQTKQLASDPEAKARVDKFQKDYMTSVQKLNVKRNNMKINLFYACKDLTEILTLVWTELDNWGLDQRLACTKLRKPKDQIMEVLDKMGESVGEAFMIILQQLDKLLNILQKLSFRDDPVLKEVKTLQPEMVNFLKMHLSRVFIVDKNIPKQVLKVTNGKSLGFSMSVRFLGGHAFGLSVNQPTISVSLYTEKQIKDLKESMKTAPDGCCKIQNGKDKSFEFLRSGNCMANFNNMVVSSVKREGRGRNEDFVTDYKHAFVFRTNIKILMGYCQTAEDIPLEAVSLPLVITSQTSQECMARGTIIWSSAFLKQEKDRALPFEAEEEVSWTRVSEVINALFKEYTCRSLTKDHLNYLAKIAFRESKNLDFDKMSISRNLILKDKLPKREFPFWKWLMSCLNSVKDTLISEWKEGLIYGFISKEDAEQKLQMQECGTFLIRFSESNIEHGQRADIHGYLTVAVCEVHPNTGNRTVFHVKESLTPKDLQEKKLAPILEAYETDDYTESSGAPRSKKLLKQLWTESELITFEDAFGKHIKHKESLDDGYNRGRYLIKIYLADANPNPDRTNWPMSPGSISAPSPAASEMYSDYPGSPGSDIHALPQLQPTICLPNAPLGVNQNLVCAVAPMEPTLNQVVNSMQGQMPTFSQQFGAQMAGIPEQLQHQLGDANIPNIDNLTMDELNSLLSNMSSTELLTVDGDDDIMLNTANMAPPSQFTTLQNVPQATLSAYQTSPENMITGQILQN